jgi:membrane protease YdiL (CAAX protease family)
VLPLARRRPVPWGGIDVLAVLVLFLAVNAAAISLACWAILPPTTEGHCDGAGADVAAAPDPDAADGAATRSEVSPPPDAEDSQEDSEEDARLHPAIRLLAEGDVWVRLLCGMGLVIVAPICEEFVFRVLLQGWLEAVGWRLRGVFPAWRRILPGTAPIVITSLLFGSVHYSSGEPPAEEMLLAIVAADVVAKVLTMLLAIALVRWRVGATAADLGWEPKRFLADIGLGLAAFAAVAAPIYAMQTGLSQVLPKGAKADPYVLVFFGAALGILYFRTHRIVPAIVLHMALNATSFTLLLYMLAM